MLLQPCGQHAIGRTNQAEERAIAHSGRRLNAGGCEHFPELEPPRRANYDLRASRITRPVDRAKAADVPELAHAHEVMFGHAHNLLLGGTAVATKLAARLAGPASTTAPASAPAARTRL